MAVTNISIAENKGRVFDSICRKLGWPRGGSQGLKKRAKWYCTGTPAIVSTDYADYPALAGDLAYDYADGSENAYIITVPVESGTSATFVKMNA